MRMPLPGKLCPASSGHCQVGQCFLLMQTVPNILRLQVPIGPSIRRYGLLNPLGAENSANGFTAGCCALPHPVLFLAYRVASRYWERATADVEADLVSRTLRAQYC